MAATDNKAHLDAVLRAFGEAVGMPDLATDDDGACLLVFDEHIQLSLLAGDDDKLIAWCPLGAVGDERRQATYERLLKANLFWRGTGGATVGLTPDGDQIVLAYQQPLPGLDADDLRTIIEAMVDHAEDLMTAIGTTADIATDTPISAGSALPPHIITG